MGDLNPKALTSLSTTRRHLLEWGAAGARCMLLGVEHDSVFAVPLIWAGHPSETVSRIRHGAMGL